MPQISLLGLDGNGFSKSNPSNISTIFRGLLHNVEKDDRLEKYCTWSIIYLRTESGKPLNRSSAMFQNYIVERQLKFQRTAKKWKAFRPSKAFQKKVYCKVVFFRNDGILRVCFKECPPSSASAWPGAACVCVCVCVCVYNMLYPQEA